MLAQSDYFNPIGCHQLKPIDCTDLLYSSKLPTIPNFLNQPLIYILLIAGVVTLLLQDWVDAGVILGVMLINATIGFVQESKAENAIAALAKSVTTIEQFSKSLPYVILGLAALMFAVVVGKGGNWTEGFKAAVALAVSAIPAGLPAVVTVTLALGVKRMAQQHAIVRKLPAVETLGSTTIICSDQTATLTENQMTVQAIYAGESTYTVSGVGYSPAGSIALGSRSVEIDRDPRLQECLQCGLLCNDSHIQSQDGQLSVAGDLTEGALIVSAQKAGLALKSLAQEQPRLDTIPFESQFQYMATLHQHQADYHTIYVKGSAESLIQRCAHQLDSDNRSIDLNRSSIEQMVDRELANAIEISNVFARVAPEQKLRLVEALQSKSEIVAMTALLAGR